MTIEIRVLAGFIEINGDRVAQILPKVDERTIMEQLEGISPKDEKDAYDAGHDDGYNEGEEDGRDEAWDDAIRAVDRIQAGDIPEDAQKYVLKVLERARP